jgi:hypothetical protein
MMRKVLQEPGNLMKDIMERLLDLIKLKWATKLVKKRFFNLEGPGI